MLDGKVVSPDGQLRVVKSGSQINLIRTNSDADPWRQDLLRRTSREPMWSERDAKECESDEDWFAARFHLRRLSELRPDDPTVESRLNRVDVILAGESTSSGIVPSDN